MNHNITSKEEILEASKVIAAKQGIQAIAMRLVAAACNVAVGTVYNYFPSKTELIEETVEEIWKDILPSDTGEQGDIGFIEYVQTLFLCVKEGSLKYGSFFHVHSLTFDARDKQTGRVKMEEAVLRIKKILLETLDRDQRVRQNVFGDHFSKEEYVHFIFANLLSFLNSKQESCDFLLELIRLTLY